MNKSIRQLINENQSIDFQITIIEFEREYNEMTAAIVEMKEGKVNYNHNVDVAISQMAQRRAALLNRLVDFVERN